jgi:hypothetical protein
LLFSASTSVSSLRLFFERILVTLNEALADNETGIAVGIASHGTCRTKAERCAWGVAAHRLPLGVPYDESMATMAFSGGIAWVDTTGQDPLAPRFVFGEGEDPPLHPEGSFDISPMTILALFRLEVSQVFKHQDGSSLLCGELDNASTHQMRKVGIRVADLAPEVGIVLLVLRDDASL